MLLLKWKLTSLFFFSRFKVLLSSDLPFQSGGAVRKGAAPRRSDGSRPPGSAAAWGCPGSAQRYASFCPPLHSYKGSRSFAVHMRQYRLCIQAQFDIWLLKTGLIWIQNADEDYLNQFKVLQGNDWSLTSPRMNTLIWIFKHEWNWRNG